MLLALARVCDATQGFGGFSGWVLKIFSFAEMEIAYLFIRHTAVGVCKPVFG